MITDRPCCDNCPHYDRDRRVLNEAKTVMSLVVPPQNPYADRRPTDRPPDKPELEYDRGACLVEKHCGPHVGPTDRCGKHPFLLIVFATLEGVTRLGKLDHQPGYPYYADGWKRYVEEFPDALRAITGPAATLPPVKEGGR